MQYFEFIEILNWASLKIYVSVIVRELTKQIYKEREVNSVVLDPQSIIPSMISDLLSTYLCPALSWEM